MIGFSVYKETFINPNNILVCFIEDLSKYQIFKETYFKKSHSYVYENKYGKKIVSNNNKVKINENKRVFILPNDYDDAKQAFFEQFNVSKDKYVSRSISKLNNFYILIFHKFVSRLFGFKLNFRATNNEIEYYKKKEFDKVQFKCFFDKKGEPCVAIRDISTHRLVNHLLRDYIFTDFKEIKLLIENFKPEHSLELKAYLKYINYVLFCDGITYQLIEQSNFYTYKLNNGNTLKIDLIDDKVLLHFKKFSLELNNTNGESISSLIEEFFFNHRVYEISEF